MPLATTRSRRPFIVPAACALLAVFGLTSACNGPGPGPTPVETTTVSTTVPGGLGEGPRPQRFAGELTQPPPNPPLPIDLSLFFSLPRASADGRPAAVNYIVTGGYNTGPGGVQGTLDGTIDGTPDDGLFAGVLTAALPGCTARRSYSGSLTRTALIWVAGPATETCGGQSPLMSNMALAPLPEPPTTTTGASTTSPTTAPTTSPTTSVPVTSTTSTTTSGPTSSTSSSTTITTTVGPSTTTSVSTTIASTSSSSTTTSTTTTVPGPTLAVAPPTGTYATTFVLTGGGYPPSCSIVVSFSSANDTFGNGALTDSGGGLRLEMAGAVFVGGTYTARAQPTTGQMACASFPQSNVVSFTVNAAPPVIAIQPTNGTRATTFVVNGSGFRAQCNFLIRFVGPTTFQIPAGTNQAGVSSTPVLGQQFQEFGTYQVTAVAATGGSACSPFVNSNTVTVVITQ